MRMQGKEIAPQQAQTYHEDSQACEKRISQQCAAGKLAQKVQPLIRRLPEGALDIIGDVHGEIEALENLLRHLGYDADGRHAAGRHVVFVGDLCDRGPDSPQVLRRVRRMIEQGNAYAVLGNHEMNLLADDAKDGSGWYFPEQLARDVPRYQDYVQMADQDKADLADFLNTLPVVLEREDIRIVHAAWLPEAVAAVRALGNIGAREAYRAYETQAQQQMPHEAWYAAYQAQLPAYRDEGRDETRQPPHLDGICGYDLFFSRANPLRSLTCGSEHRAERPFYAAGRWRLTTRSRWWLDYDDAVPVVMGHYWRQWRTRRDERALLFPETGDCWLGKRKNVFCVDFSVGAKWKTRLPDAPPHGVFRLAALRFPEKTLMFDDGETAATRA